MTEITSTRGYYTIAATVRLLNRAIAPATVGRTTISAWIHRGLRGRRLPAVRFAGRNLIKLADLGALLGIPLATLLEGAAETGMGTTVVTLKSDPAEAAAR